MPTAPAGGWAKTDTASMTSDLSSVPSSDTYLGLVAYKIQHGRAKEFAKGIDATQGKFYRSQPGCIAYMFGLSRQDEDTVLGTAIWSSKDLFESLPKNPKDLEKLNEVRAPFKALVEDMSIVETSVTFGIGHQKHATGTTAATSEDKQASFDEIMGTYGRRSVLPAAAPESNVYTVHVEMKAQPGKGEEVAIGLEATQGRFYRTQPGCHAYQFGISASDEDTVVGVAIWSSKELFDSLPKEEKDLEKLNEARAPYMKMIEDQGIKSRDTTITFGNSFYSDHFENYSHGVQASQ